MKRRLKAGMVGGGRGGFIGGVHRTAMRLDGRIELVRSLRTLRSRNFPARICFWIQSASKVSSPMRLQ